MHGNQALWEAIDRMKQDIEGNSEQELMAKLGKSTMAGLSAGFVVWLLRGGSLLAALLSAMPLWRRFDPLPILAYRRKTDEKKRRPRKDEDDAEALRSLFLARSKGRGGR